jgi:iron complex outermembrane receptor protein
MLKIKFLSIVFLFNLTFLVGQTTISGVVKDNQGIPLPGASIVEEGTSNGTTTDFDGNFTLSVEDNSKYQ